MAFPDRAAKRLSDFLPVLKDQNMDFLVAAGEPGVSLQYAKITQVGASPFAVSLSTDPASKAKAGTLRAMADANYAVFVYDVTGQAYLNVPAANVAAKSFNISGGSDTDVLWVVVIGRLAGEAI